MIYLRMAHHDANKRVWIVGLLLTLLSLLTRGAPALAQEPTRIIFLHHSCGHNLIEEGGVREGLTQLGYDFYDHGYNEQGLRLPDGTYAGRNFDVPGDNTDPDGFAEIFAQPLHDPPDNAFSHLMQYDVIAFKSCFPVSNIADAHQLEAYKQHYLAIRERMDQYPEKAFIIVTQPPQVPGASNRQEANRARAWTQWLRSDEFLAGHSNVFVFDFFDYLAGDDNFLRREYRYDNYDGHPNARANEEIGPHFVDFIHEVAQDFEPGEPVVAPEVTEEVEEAATEEAAMEEAGPPPPAEAELSGAWEASTSGPDATMTCGVAPDVTREGNPVVGMAYEIADGNYADCGQYFEAAQDWSGSEGFGVWIRAEKPGDLIFTVLMGRPGAVSPFDVTFDVTEACCQDWTYTFLPWSDFAQAPWAEAGSADVLDPAQIAGYGFTLDAYGGDRAGTLLLDVVGPTRTGATAPLESEEVTEEAPEMEPPLAEEPEDDSPAGGLCPGSMALPVIVGGVVLALQKRYGE